MLLEEMNDRIDGHYNDLVAWVPDFKMRDELEEWLNQSLGDAGEMAKEAYREFLLGDDEKAFDWMCRAAAQSRVCAVALTRFRHGLGKEWPAGKNQKERK